MILSRSSGSSGKRLDILADAQFFIDKALVAHRWHDSIMDDYKSSDKEVLIYTSHYPYRSIFGFFYPAYYVHTLDPIDYIYERITDVKPAFIAGYPSVLLELISKYRDELEALKGIKAICTHSEHSTQAQRDFIGRVFHCKAYDEYSTEELSKCAFQCRHRNYHLQEDCAYIEVLDTLSDDEVAEGEIGEITGTSLHNNVMPFIRYRQGDLGSIEASKCECNMNARTLKNLSGRKNASFIRKNGEMIPSGKILDWTYELFLTHTVDIQQFQVIQKTVEDVEVVIVPGPTYDPLVCDKLIANSFKKGFGLEFFVEITKVHSIPKTPAGKHLPIQSLVTKDSDLILTLQKTTPGH